MEYFIDGYFPESYFADGYFPGEIDNSGDYFPENYFVDRSFPHGYFYEYDTTTIDGPISISISLSKKNITISLSKKNITMELIA